MSGPSFVKTHQRRYQALWQVWKKRPQHNLFPVVFVLFLGCLVGVGLLEVWVGLLPRFLEVQHGQQLSRHKKLQESLRQLESMRATQNGNIEVRAQKELGMRYPHQTEGEP